MDISSIPSPTFAFIILVLKFKTNISAKNHHLHTWQIPKCHQSNLQKSRREARLLIVLLSIPSETKTSSAKVS